MSEYDLRRLGGRKPRSAEERFAESYTPEPNSGCWLWLGAARGSNGYGRIKAFGKNMTAHRYSWVAAYGAIPDGMLVCHKCDNPACVNPSHLFLGTALDNMADCKRKWRTGGGTKTPLRGESNHRSKLTSADVSRIRADGRPQRAIASEYGVSQALVSKIKLNEIWRHL